MTTKRAQVNALGEVLYDVKGELLYGHSYEHAASKASGQPEAPQHSPQWHGAYDADGKLRATFDSSSEAYHYVRNRGHMYGGSDKPIASVNHAQALAEALRRAESHIRLNLGCEYYPTNISPVAVEIADQATAALAAWKEAQQ